MTIAEMFEQSGVLTLLGMGMVFGFLVLLVICIQLAGKLIHALKLDTDAAGTAGTNERIPAPVVAAITAAVIEYRRME